MDFQIVKKHTMVLNLIIALLFGIIISIFDLTGLVLLKKVEDVNVNGNQKYLIIALSLTELASILLSVIPECIFYASGSRTYIAGLYVTLYSMIVIPIIYYFIMFAITLDRFLELRLNIKYNLYLNENRTKKTLILVCCFVNIACLILLYIILSYRQPTLVSNIHETIHKNFYIYFTPVTDTIFVIFAMTVYSYIFYKLYNNRRKGEALMKQVKCNETAATNILTVNRYRVPFRIILTFILFWIVPNILQLISNCHPGYHGYFHLASYVLYRIGYIADAVIYILNLNYVRVKLGEIKRNVFNKITQ